jgi:MYND finger
MSQCGSCLIVLYCGPDCQKTDWKKSHKSACPRTFAKPKSTARPPATTDASSKPATKSRTVKQTSSQNAASARPVKENAFIIRAKPKDSSKSVIDNIKDQIEPLHLTGIGSETAEKCQIQLDLQWPGVMEVGKFYDHESTNTWYYYAYGSTNAYTSGSALKNEVATLVCYETIYGDVVVVRSGPLNARYDEIIDKSKLGETIDFYKSYNRQSVFTDREMSRFLGTRPVS